MEMRRFVNHRFSEFSHNVPSSLSFFVENVGGGGGGVGGGGNGNGGHHDHDESVVVVESGELFVNFSNLLSNFSDFSNNNNKTKEHEPFGWTDFALLFLYCSVILGTVIGNTLVIASVATTRRLRTITNCFVMSLSVADFMVGCFVMPLKLVLFLVDNEWHLGRVICVLWISLDILLCTASILSLCAISIDRYLAITRPLAYSRKRRSKRLALSMISCVWVAAVIITSPPIFGWYDSERNGTNGDLECEYNDDTGYVVYSALGSFFLPLLVMLYVYARIALVIARRQKTIEKLHIQTQKKFCEDQDGGMKDETTSRVLDSLDEHNRVERSSSSSASHAAATVTPNSPRVTVTVAVKKKDPSLWRRLRSSCAGSSKKTDDNPPKPERSFLYSDGGVSYGESGTPVSDYHRDLIRSNTQIGGRRSCGNGRTRTGSRLCHHSVSALSPQRSIRRAKASASATVISLSDGDLSGSGNNVKRDGSRIWTIDCNESQSSNKLNGRHGNCSSEILAYDDGQLIEHSLTELHSRIYPTPTLHPHHHHHHHSPRQQSQQQHQQQQQQSSVHQRELLIHGSTNASGGGGGGCKMQTLSVQRQRSMKSTIVNSLRVSSPAPSDQNQNSAVAREFTSGRMASFKRETKTAQTLAAVVGCFIFCWVPFFVAYVLSPFTKIPVPLMNGLIWLGWGNSAINPFIYAFYSPDFRNAFWRLTFHKCESLFRRRRRRRGGGGGGGGDRNSPRRYDDTNATPGLRTSA